MMRMAVAGVLTTMCAAATLGTQAQTRDPVRPFDRALQACGGRATVGGATDLECVNQVNAQLEAALERAYQKLRAETRPAARQAELAEAQGSWQRYRSAHCGLIATDPEGGTIRHLATAWCRYTISAQRLRELSDPLFFMPPL